MLVRRSFRIEARDSLRLEHLTDCSKPGQFSQPCVLSRSFQIGTNPRCDPEPPQPRRPQGDSPSKQRWLPKTSARRCMRSRRTPRARSRLLPPSAPSSVRSTTYPQPWPLPWKSNLPQFQGNQLPLTRFPGSISGISRNSPPWKFAPAHSGCADPRSWAQTK